MLSFPNQKQIMISKQIAYYNRTKCLRGASSSLFWDDVNVIPPEEKDKGELKWFNRKNSKTCLNTTPGCTLMDTLLRR